MQRLIAIAMGQFCCRLDRFDNFRDLELKTCLDEELVGIIEAKIGVTPAASSLSFSLDRGQRTVVILSTASDRGGPPLRRSLRADPFGKDRR
jgi:hypothetical protein